VSVESFLRQRAVNVAVSGRYRLANWYDPSGKAREFACRTSRVSPFQMLVSVPVTGKCGERVSTYFSDFGRLDGWIIDVVSGGLLLELAIERGRREQLANKLTWIEKRQNDASILDARRQRRILPEDPEATLVFGDGTTRRCLVLDMSTSGVAVSANVLPQLGTPLAVGACVGRVVRHFREGFAVRFVELQNPNRLEALVGRPVAGHNVETREQSATREDRGAPSRRNAADPSSVVFV
jgi:hypothetical protein